MARMNKKKRSAKPRGRPAKKAIKKAAKKVAKKKAPAKQLRIAPPPKPDARRRPAKSLIRRPVEGAMRAMPRMPPRFGAGKYDADLERNPANYQSLTLLTFLERAASVFPSRTAIIHGKQRFSYADYYERSRRLASALVKKGLRKGDT